MASAIIGGTSLERIDENLEATEVTLSEDLLKNLDELSPPPEVVRPQSILIWSAVACRTRLGRICCWQARIASREGSG
jgi:hypothetical protein